MNIQEKRDLLVQKALSRKEKNRYSQDVSLRTLIEIGYGDCSGTVWYWYKKLFGINIGVNTQAQINSPIGKRIELNITNGIPDETKMRKGDLLYFRGSDNSRTEGVGHVEMYIGGGQIFGHGSGIGGTVKNMRAYCLQRQNAKSTTKLKNKGLICVIRFLNDKEVEELTEINDIVWELRHRRIISDANLWTGYAKENNNIYWLIRKAVHYIREREQNAKCVCVEMLEKNSDNVWELHHRKIISNSLLWNSFGLTDSNVYWLMKKIVYFIRQRDI